VRTDTDVALSWRGSEQLKYDLLQQLAARRQAAELGPLELDGTSLVIFAVDFTSTPDIGEVATVLAIPRPVLAFGYAFFSTFPDDAAWKRELAASYAEFFEAIPVGVELADVMPRYIEWALAELRPLVDHPEVQALVDYAAVEIWDADGSPSLPVIERLDEQLKAERETMLQTDIAARRALQPRRRERFVWSHREEEPRRTKLGIALAALRAVCTRPLPVDAAATVALAVAAMVPESQEWRRKQVYDQFLDRLRAA